LVGRPRDRILGIFELMTEWFATSGYHGCPFINAGAEAAASDAVQEVRGHPTWAAGLFARLAREAGAEDVEGRDAGASVLIRFAQAGRSRVRGGSEHRPCRTPL
jgi:hypothetical protein